MKKVIITMIFIAIIAIPTISIARPHVSHSTSHKSSTSHSTTIHSSTPKTTIKSYKTFTPKYNTSNIKTEKINSNPSNYTKYSSTSLFKPNAWTAMWLFACMNNNSKEVTEQDIAKELEERGYSEDEINSILEEGKQEQKEDAEDEKKNNKIALGIVIIFAIIAIGIIIAMAICFK